MSDKKLTPKEIAGLLQRGSECLLATIASRDAEIARLAKIEERAKEILREREDSTAAYILEGGTRHVGKPDARKGAAMDREALIVRLRTGHPTQLTLEAANALASDAKKEAAVKALCDDLGIGLARLVSGIRAIYGWNATTKDLHTKTTKGDT